MGKRCWGKQARMSASETNRRGTVQTEKFYLAELTNASNMTESMIPTISQWKPAYGLLGSRTLRRDEVTWLCIGNRAPRKFVYTGDFEDTNIRIYEHCSRKLGIMLFRPIVNPVLTVDCITRNEQGINITLTTLAGNVVFDQPFEGNERFTVAELTKIACRGLRTNGLLSKSMVIQIVRRETDGAPLRGNTVLIKGCVKAEADPQKKNCFEEEQTIKSMSDEGSNSNARYTAANNSQRRCPLRRTLRDWSSHAFGNEKKTRGQKSKERAEASEANKTLHGPEDKETEGSGREERSEAQELRNRQCKRK
eukprot:1451788-Karenia_brevis.AAC.1